MSWQQEIIELHDFFQAYFLGEEDSQARAEAAMHPDFTIVGPDGVVSDRGATLEMLRGGQGGLTTFVLSTHDHRLLHSNDEVIMASYVEAQQRGEGPNERLSTVVFLVDPEGPNGLRWLRVHETWMPDSPDT